MSAPQDPPKSAEQPRCGIVMPIATFGDYEAQHWLEVRAILERSICKSNHVPSPVWEHTETDIIQGRIIRNLYEYDVVLCDISGLNPNVMFELGLRLAFKKPVIIVVDDETKIPFDTNVIEHIIYNRGLNFQKTELFIDRICEKISSIMKSYNAKTYIAYIDALGAFSTFEPMPQKVEFDQFVLDKLDQISSNLSRMGREHMHNSAMLNAMYHQPANALAAFDEDRTRFDDTRWSPAREAILIDAWGRGKTASEIASLLGGMSRNAVIGKAHRLGLKATPQGDRSSQVS